MTIQHFGQEQLAQRWGISTSTLERWRWSGEGPRFLKLGGRVVYRLEDIEAFEAEKLRNSTSGAAPQMMPDFRQERAVPQPALQQSPQVTSRRRAS
jgi:predicted DNA-binding transcriptional regulator AlpA